MYACGGAVAACSVSAGCDAGVCLTAPAPARTFCDGGQCDGAGRCAPFCDPARATLAACYRFEGNLADESGNGNAGTAVSASFVAGSRGRGLQPGTAGMLVGDRPSLDCTTALTIEAWVKLSAWPVDAGYRYGVLDNNGQYGVFIGPSGELRCSLGVVSVAAQAVTVGNWHHIGCVFDGPGRQTRSYLDGVLLDTVDSGLPDGGQRVLGLGDTAGLTIGEQSPSGDVLQGVVDGVRIWCEPRQALDFCDTLGECG